MIIINILIWIWVITFLINVIWYQYNPKFLKSLYDEHDFYNKLNYSYYYIIIHISTLIIAPYAFYYIIIGELKNYFFIWRIKKQLKKQLKKIKNDELKKEIDKIKY